MGADIMRKLVENWIAAVCSQQNVLVEHTVAAIQAAGADKPGPHWRILEHDAYQRCVANGCLWSADVRGSLLHAAFAKTPFFTEVDTNGHP
jgi:hypothetical protein